MPVPLGPITPIRSPNRNSASNGDTIPAIARPFARNATLPVRPPPIRILTSCTAAFSGGGLALEPLEAVLGVARLRRPAVVVGGLALHLLHHLGEALALVVVPAVPLVEPLHAVVARLRVGGERPDVGPRRAALQGHGLRRGPLEHRTVVGDEQDRPRVGGDRVLEPLLARDIERVVGLVEEQDVERSAEDRLERQALALAARERLDLPVGALGVAAAEREVRGLVPADLGVVPARLAPARERVGVPTCARSPGSAAIVASAAATRAAASRTAGSA